MLCFQFVLLGSRIHSLPVVRTPFRLSLTLTPTVPPSLPRIQSIGSSKQVLAPNPFGLPTYLHCTVPIGSLPTLFSLSKYQSALSAYNHNVVQSSPSYKRIRTTTTRPPIQKRARATWALSSARYHVCVCTCADFRTAERGRSATNWAPRIGYTTVRCALAASSWTSVLGLPL